MRHTIPAGHTTLQQPPRTTRPSAIPSSAASLVLGLPLALLLTGCTAAAPLSASTTADYWDPKEAPIGDHVHKPSVRTVQLFKEGFELAPPIIELGGQEAVVLRFDDLDPDPEYLSYTLVHCDAHWHPTDLLPGQYLTGAISDHLPPARQSFNTLQPFLQYEVRIPNEVLRIGRSGNYLLKVFRDNDENDLVLTRRMMVYEQKVHIDASVKASRQVDMRDVAQQVDLVVRHAELPVQDPFGEIHVALLQNMRWDDLRTGLTPRFMRGHELVYDFPEQGLFMGGNEYRNFDLKDLRIATQHVARIEPGAGEGVYHAHLLPEPKRNTRVYLDHPDLNGRFFVRNDFFDGDPVGADYVMVHFTLSLPAPLPQDIHVFGAFSDWRCTKENRMTWDPGHKAYRAAILLKQGFYDYAYATLPRGSSTADITTVEGSHFQTENDYLVLVYFTDRMQRCDRLVGMRFLNSRGR